MEILTHSQQCKVIWPPFRRIGQFLKPWDTHLGCPPTSFLDLSPRDKIADVHMQRPWQICTKAVNTRQEQASRPGVSMQTPLCDGRSEPQTRTPKWLRCRCSMGEPKLNTIFLSHGTQFIKTENRSGTKVGRVSTTLAHRRWLEG